MAYIKNISHEEVLHLTDQISADKGQIVSKTLAPNDYVSVTLFAFSKDEEIATLSASRGSDRARSCWSSG